MVNTLEKINPVDHGVKMYDIFRKGGMTHEQALFRALCVTCEEQRGRCVEACEETARDFIEHFKRRPDIWDYHAMRDGANKAAERIGKLPPVNLDPKTGILR